MSRRIYKVKDIFLPLVDIIHLNGVALYRDAPLPLKIQIVKHLILEVPFVDCPRLFQEPVRQRALTMIDMGYDAEVPNVIHLYYINL